MKEQLALFGGKPVFNKKISYGHQWIDESDVQAVCDVLRSDYLTCGPKIKELEDVLAEYTGVNYAVAVANGTAALHCACIAAGIQPGDEVITTPITFAASANCILYCGAKPVFADINPETYNIDPQSIRENITNKTKAVIAVDFTGQAVQIKEIQEICNQYGLIFIEDAAHSIGTQYKGKRIGSLADMTCFSFHPVKTVTSGEGGAVLTNNKQLYDKIILAHTHGITKNINQMEEKSPEGSWYYEEICLGFNYRITDFQAALLISQLKKLARFIERRKKIVRIYNEAFANIPEILIQKEIPEWLNLTKDG